MSKNGSVPIKLGHLAGMPIENTGRKNPVWCHINLNCQELHVCIKQCTLYETYNYSTSEKHLNKFESLTSRDHQ